MTIIVNGRIVRTETRFHPNGWLGALADAFFGDSSTTYVVIPRSIEEDMVMISVPSHPPLYLHGHKINEYNFPGTIKIRWQAYC